MLRPIDNYFLSQAEHIKSCFDFLRTFIPKLDTNITETWKYKLPVYCYKGKMFCYFNIHKKTKQPYIGIVKGDLLDFPELLLEKRKRIKIFLINPNEDIPIERISLILKTASKFYK